MGARGLRPQGQVALVPWRDRGRGGCGSGHCRGTPRLAPDNTRDAAQAGRPFLSGPGFASGCRGIGRACSAAVGPCRSRCQHAPRREPRSVACPCRCRAAEIGCAGGLECPPGTPGAAARGCGGRHATAGTGACREAGKAAPPAAEAASPCRPSSSPDDEAGRHPERARFVQINGALQRRCAGSGSARGASERQCRAAAGAPNRLVPGRYAGHGIRPDRGFRPRRSGCPACPDRTGVAQRRDLAVRATRSRPDHHLPGPVLRPALKGSSPWQ